MRELSNYPPGVSGNEWQITGICPECGLDGDECDAVAEPVKTTECCACCIAASERGELDHKLGNECPCPPCDYCQP